MKMKNLWMLSAIICCGLLMTACSNEDNPSAPESPTLAKALLGEWISEIEIDEFVPDDPDVEVEPSVDGYMLTFIYHFNEDGSCWKEINLMKDGEIVYQPVDRFSTLMCNYTIDEDGKVVVEYEDSEEGDELYFDGTSLTEEYGDTELDLQRATEAQIKFYQEQADGWHGGAAAKKKDAWGKDFNKLVNSAELKSLFTDFKARLTVGEMRGKVLMLSKEVYAEKPLGGYCYGWDSYLELAQQQKAYITAADGSKTPLWVQDYWKDITRENKSKALVGMLEASVKRDMTAEKPAWVINFPSAYLIPFS